jgi:putative membrane protein
MGIAYVVVALLSAAVAVFALQNNQPMSLRFLAWSLESVPLAGALLVSLGAGLLLGAVPLWVSQWRWRSRARALEAKVDMLESALTTRDTALLTPRPAATRGSVAPPEIRSA